MSRSFGESVQVWRRLRGWSQEHLADQARVDRRTVQRIEAAGSPPTASTCRKLAEALGVDAAHLWLGVSEESLTTLRGQFLCPTCGAAMEGRTFIDYEHGDVEFEEFACGHTRGWKRRPCPKDPAFPDFDDYELKVFDKNCGQFCCVAIGQTAAARAVELPDGSGQTPEAAKRWVRRSYIQARDGRDAAEAAFPFRESLSPV